MTFFEDAVLTSTTFIRVLQARNGQKKTQGKIITMTQLLNGLDLNTALAQVEVYDKNGRVDPARTREATKAVLSDANTVRFSGGAVDHASTLTKRQAAKLSFLANN